jgi:glycosyltransferase involved in cell wall biosynthesis
MKICYITSEYPKQTENYGGIAIVFEKEVQELRKLGFDVEVIIVSNKKTLDRVNLFYINFFDFPQTGNWKGIRGRINLLRYINSKFSKNDLVVTSDFMGLVPWFICANKVTQLHGSLTINALGQNRRINLVTYFLEYLTIITSNKIRAVSTSIYQKTTKWFPFTKYRKYEVIFNGIEGQKHLDSLSYLYDVIFIGKLSNLKGVQFLSEIINSVNKELPNINFLIIGHDEIKNGISEKEKLMNEIDYIGNVTFIERVNNEEISKLITSSKILMITSLTEALPTVVIEAFANKRPIIAFNVGGLSEMVDNEIEGFLIPPFDIENYVEKLIFFLNSKSKQIQMNNTAYQKYLSQFKLENQICKLIDFYKK